MPKLGNIFLNTVYEEKPNNAVKITDHPIENGSNVTDHVKREPLTMNISGIVSGPDASTRLTQLRDAMKIGKRMKYVYRNIFNNMVIESFQSTHDAEVKHAFKFTMTLKQVEIANRATVVKLKKPVTNGGQKQPGKPTNKPKKVYTVAKGDNLSKIAKKFGTTASALYSKNKGVIGKNANLLYPGQKLVI